MVKVTIIEESEDKIKILMAETDRALVNSIRRSLISDTPPAKATFEQSK